MSRCIYTSVFTEGDKHYEVPDSACGDTRNHCEHAVVCSAHSDYWIECKFTEYLPAKEDHQSTRIEHPEKCPFKREVLPPAPHDKHYTVQYINTPEGRKVEVQPT